MATRRQYSLDRLADLGRGLDPVRPLLDGKPICVYVTGSYGRLEGWAESDADLFFLYDGDNAADRFPWITFTRLAACLVDATETMQFPPFSGDGRYLEVLYVREMEEVLGSPDDDSTNAFTARMLLLLERQPVYNDILRFWRTLTLNYEHHRRGLQGLAGEELRTKKASSALKNYKLKVSRMAACYSMIASLSSEPRPVTAETVLGLCRMTPAERLAHVGDRSAGARVLVARLERTYEEFLQDVQRPESVLLTEFADEGVRSEKLDRAAEYGKLIYELLAAIVPEDRMRYLVV